MMHDKVDDLTESKKGGRFKILKWVLIGSAGLCLLIFFGTPVFLSSAGGTNMLVGKINAAMDGQVAIDDLSVGWFKGVELTNLSYVDEANLSAVHVRQITAQPKYTSLLSNRIKLGKTVIDSPKVHLKVPAGPIAVDEEKPTDVAASVEKKQIDLQMDLEVIDGAATIEVAGPSPQTLELKNIASRVILGQTGQASSVELSAMVDESGAISAKGSAKPAENGWMLADGDFSVQVSKLELASLKPLFAMVGQEMDMAGQLNADATVQVSGGQLTTLQADAVIDNFAQGTGAQRVAFIKPVALSAKTSGSGQTLRIDSLDVNSDFCKISCSGTMEQLDYAVDADLSQTLHFAGQFADLQGMSAKGHVAAAGKVNLTAEKVSIVSDVVVRQLVVQKDTAKTPVTDVALNINSALDKTANQLQIASMDLKATPGAVSIKDLVLPLSGEAIETVSLDAEAKLDLAGVWPFVQVFADVPDDLKLAGMLNSAVKISTQASQIQLVTEGTRVDDLKIARGDDAPFVQDVINLDGDILLDTAAQTVDVRSLQLTGKQGQSLIEVTKGTLENKTSGQNTHLKGDFQAAYDLKTVSALGAAYLPEGLALEGKRDDTIQFESVYPTAQPELLTKNLNAAATFGFDKAAYHGLNIGKTDMKLNVAGGVAEFAIAEAPVNNGTMQFAATVDLNEETKVLRLTEPMRVLEGIHLNEELTHTMLRYLSPVFAEQGDISGFASLACNELVIPFDADKQNEIVVDGVIEMDKMQLQAKGLVGDILALTERRSQFNAKLLPSRIILKNGVMSYDEMEFHLEDYPTGFAGKIYLDKRLNMQVLVPYKVDIENLRIEPVRIGEDLSERLALPIKGSVDNSQVLLEESFDAILKQYAPQLLERGIRELLENL